MSEETLYNLLAPSQKIPWDKAAEHFMVMKLASGGLLAEEVDLLKMAADVSVSQEDFDKAMQAGTLSGIRNTAAQEIAQHAKQRRSRGERIGKGVGTAAGIGAGLLASRGGHTIGEKAFRTAVGAALGNVAGKTVGQEIDTHRTAKHGDIEKQAVNIAGLGEKLMGMGSKAVSGVTSLAAKHPKMVIPAMGAGVGAVAGAAGAEPGHRMGGALTGAAVGGGLGAGGQYLRNSGALKGLMTPKVAAAVAKIKLAWSLRNFFRAAQGAMPPEDIGEAAASGAMQEGPSGALNEAIGQAGGLAGHALGERIHMPGIGAMVGNLGAKAGAEQLTEPKLAAAKDVMKSAIKRLHAMHKKAEMECEKEASVIPAINRKIRSIAGRGKDLITGSEVKRLETEAQRLKNLPAFEDLNHRFSADRQIGWLTGEAQKERTRVLGARTALGGTALAGGTAAALHKGKDKSAEQGRDGLSTTDEEPVAGQGERSSNPFPAEAHDGNDAAPETNPVVQVPQDLKPSPVDQIMELIQKGNEADFHQTRADEATQALDAAEERASMLENQMQQLIQELDAAKSEGMGQAQMSGEQASASAQEAMMARNESLVAQQQALALRQAITSYRQGLMDMLAQDPTAAVGPPPVPVAPLPGQDPNAGAAGPPGAAEPGGMAPTTEAQPASPPEAAGGPPGAPPMAPDAGPPAGGPSLPGGAAGGGSGAPVNIHIQQPKSSAPKAAKPPSSGSKG